MRSFVQAVCALSCLSVLAGCSNSAPPAGSAATSPEKSAQTAPASSPDKLSSDPEFVTLRQVWKLNNQEPFLPDVLNHATAAKSVREYVRTKYGGLKAQQFCQFFGSPEFASLARDLMGSPPTIRVMPNQTEALQGSYTAGSLVVYPEDDDPYRYDYDKAGADGKIESGGSDRIEP